mgnify:CR=1 FL=1
MTFTSVNKTFQESFKKNWERPAISNYQGVTLKYGDVARRMAKLVTDLLTLSRYDNNKNQLQKYRLINQRTLFTMNKKNKTAKIMRFYLM